MKLKLLVFGLVVLLAVNNGYGRPLDDENNAKEGDDAALAEKRDKVAGNKKKEDADNTEETGKARQGAVTKPTTQPTTKATTQPKKKVTTTVAPKETTTTPIVPTTAATAPSKEPVTTAGSKPTAAPKPTTATSATVVTTAPVTTPVVTTPAPGSTPTVPPSKQPTVPQEEGDVENSANNTKNMNATTFHVAIRFLGEKWSDDLQIPVNPVYQNTKQMVQKAVEEEYTDNPAFKQVVIIGFSDSENQKKAERRANVKPAPPGVVADFYLRFHTFGTHLRQLSKAISDGKLDTQPVSKIC